MCVRFLIISLDDAELEKYNLGKACKCNRYKNNFKKALIKNVFLELLTKSVWDKKSSYIKRHGLELILRIQSKIMGSDQV